MKDKTKKKVVKRTIKGWGIVPKYNGFWKAGDIAFAYTMKKDAVAYMNNSGMKGKIVVCTITYELPRDPST